MSHIQWGYALNQWKPQFDDFVRREEHDRAFKTISIAGFTGVELTAASGRWEPFGNPQQIVANFGSVAGLRAALADCGIEAVSSMFFDPQQRFVERLMPPYSPIVAEDLDAIVSNAEWLAEALAELGGSVLVVAGAPEASEVTDTDQAVAQLARCWSAVGTATARFGVRTAVHMDFLSALRRPGALDALLDATDPELVGLVVDTAELQVAGIDPVAFIRRHRDRIVHVHLKDALAVDEAGEYEAPHAKYVVRQRGGERGIPRWFAEPGVRGGLVDIDGVIEALVQADYSGWVVVESDQSPHPATSALLAGYVLQRRLQPLVSGPAAS
ncbi:MAG: sugar phosphate isomerase/epimerase [Pseudolysinimonas sp.]